MLLFAACDDDCPGPPPDYCAKDHVTIQQGVYGRLIAVEDAVMDCPSYPDGWSGMHASLQVSGQDAFIAEDVTDERGFYELAAPAAGDYQVCVGGRCSQVTVPDGVVVRFDAAGALGGPAPNADKCN